MKSALKTKTKSVSSLKKKVWAEFSRFIRLRDALRTTRTLTDAECITCGKLLPIRNMDAGHYVSRMYNNTLFDERNVHAQCKRCNKYLGGNTIEYEKKIIKMYGEQIATELKDLATEIKQFSIPELEELLEYYKAKNKELLGGIK